MALATPTFWVNAEPGDTIVLKGDLDLAAVKSFERAMRPVIDRGGPVVVDASQLMFLDSTGLRLFIHAAKRLNATGGCLIVHGLTDIVRKVITLAGLADGLPGLHFLDHNRQEPSTVQTGHAPASPATLSSGSSRRSNSASVGS